MQEEFKLFREFKKSNRYFKKGDILTVSNFGRVKLNGQPHKCRIGTDGYYYLCGIPLHRIIAEKFISGWKKDYEIDHKDRNRLNNMVTNLLVCKDRKQNMANPLTRQQQKISSHKKSVLQYTKDNKFVAEYVSIREAERQTKICYGNIIKCCRHKNGYKSAGGFIWEYKN